MRKPNWMSRFIGPILIAAFLASFCLGCAGQLGSVQAVDGLITWCYKSHVYNAEVYKTASPEYQAFLRKDVFPYLNIMKHASFAIDAMQQDDTARAAAEVGKVTLIAAGVEIEYDPTKLIEAIQADPRDYEAIETELMVLKSKIIQVTTK